MGIDPPAPFHPNGTRRIRTSIQVYISVIVPVVLQHIEDNIITKITNDFNSTNLNDWNEKNGNEKSLLSTTETMYVFALSQRHQKQQQDHDDDIDMKEYNDVDDNNDNDTTAPRTTKYNNMVSLPSTLLKVYETYEECIQRILYNDMKIVSSSDNDEIISSSSYSMIYTMNHIQHDIEKHDMHIIMKIIKPIPYTSLPKSLQMTTTNDHQHHHDGGDDPPELEDRISDDDDDDDNDNTTTATSSSSSFVLKSWNGITKHNNSMPTLLYKNDPILDQFLTEHQEENI